MRWLLTCLVMLGVCAGLQARVIVTDPCDVISSSHEHPEHHHDHGKPCEPDHDKHCPLEHHHHGCFCHGMPLVDAADHAVRLRPSCMSLARLAHDRQSPPDGPFLSEDKPPLI